MPGKYDIEALYQANLEKDNLPLNGRYILYTPNNYEYYDILSFNKLDEHYKIRNKTNLIKYFNKSEKISGSVTYNRLLEISEDINKTDSKTKRLTR